jgi:hypothetical protein
MHGFPGDSGYDIGLKASVLLYTPIKNITNDNAFVAHLLNTPFIKREALARGCDGLHICSARQAAPLLVNSRVTSAQCATVATVMGEGSSD